jgi:non-ribosomal peptide synthetase-like protein
VKVRGHRVDLQEIENVLLEDGDVASAVVALVTVGATKELAAYVTRHSPIADAETIEALSQRLADNARRRLPAYMVPRYLDVLPALPILPSGKVDRKSLPAPSGSLLVAGQSEHVAATTAVEQEIAEVWSRVFGIPASAVSVAADFFLDLGGHSLLAATAVSELRRTRSGKHLAIRDLYAHPTVRALARRCDEVAAKEQQVESTPEPLWFRLQHSSRRVVQAGLAQLAMLYLVALVFGLPVAMVYSSNDGRISLEMLVVLALATAVTYLFGRWLLVPLGVRVLTARIGPGRYPLWSATYLRLWLAQRLLALGPGPMLSGSPFLPAYLRLCGATVKQHCHFATSDFPLPGLTRIGSDVSIGYGARVQPFVVEDGRVTVQMVTIDNGAFVGANALLLAGATVGRHASIGEHSLVAQRQTIPPGEHWTGSPSSRAEQLDATLARMRRLPAGRVMWRKKLFVGYIGGIALLELLPFLFMTPAVALVWWMLLSHGVVAGLIATLFAGPLWVLTACLTIACGKELVMPHTVSGIHPLRSGFGLRKWFTDKLLEMSLTVTNALYATLYTVPWLRALGARIGGWAEVSTAAQLDPDLLVLDEGSFIADMASVGSAAYCNGYVACGYTVVGHRSFVGNASFVRSGARLGDRSLVGVHTVSPTDGVPSDSSWLGSPAIYLPRRQESEVFDDELTFRPSRRRVIERLAIEFLRITLPPTLLAVAIYFVLLATSLLARSTDAFVVAAAVPLVTLLSGLGVVVTVAAMKWVIVGRYVPRVAPLWDRFVRRSEFVTGLYEAAAVPALLALLTGTPLLGPLLRLFGTRVGKRTWLDTTYLTEFDLVTIGDDAAVGTNSSLQTHLFEDRVMKMSRVTIARGANVGTRAVVLYDSVIGTETSLDGLSLVMKGEHLNGANQWRGIPAQAVA